MPANTGSHEDRKIHVMLDDIVKLLDIYEHKGTNVNAARMADLKTIVAYCRDESDGNLDTLAGTL